MYENHLIPSIRNQQTDNDFFLFFMVLIVFTCASNRPDDIPIQPYTANRQFRRLEFSTSSVGQCLSMRFLYHIVFFSFYYYHFPSFASTAAAVGERFSRTTAPSKSDSVSMATAPLTCRHTMLLTLALCVILSCAAAAVSPSDALPESNNGRDAGPVDADEYGVRNYVSDHELPRDVPTRVKIVGDLGTPPPSVHVDFVPKQTYVQVRRYDAVKRLPQEEAANEASTSEELANASRLREVVTHKKTQEVKHATLYACRHA